MPNLTNPFPVRSTFKGKTATSLTSVIIRIRVNNQGDQLEGWALYLRK